MKVLFVDEEEQVLRGLSRMIEAELDDVDVETARSGEEALEILEDEEFNAIVSDLCMPGMDGNELLETVAVKYPQLFRVVLSGQATRETVLGAVQPMHQYLSKPCDPDRLIAVLKRAEAFQENIRSTEVLHAIGQSNCLPSIPESLSDLNLALDNENSTIEDISEIISRDPALAAKILQVANSAIFGLTHPVAELPRGVNVIGYEMIRTIAVSQSLFSGSITQSSIFSPQKLFGHCFDCALISRKISRLNSLDANSQYLAFSSALLHDVGKMVLANAFTERYQAILEEHDEEKELWELELTEFSATHQGVGAYLLDLWGLPGEVVQAVVSHHSFDICAKSELYCQLVYAANWIANGADPNLLERRVAKTSDPVRGEAFKEQLIRWQGQLAQSEGYLADE